MINEFYKSFLCPIMDLSQKHDIYFLHITKKLWEMQSDASYGLHFQVIYNQLMKMKMNVGNTRSQRKQSRLRKEFILKWALRDSQ